MRAGIAPRVTSDARLEFFHFSCFRIGLFPESKDGLSPEVGSLLTQRLYSEPGMGNTIERPFNS